MAEIVYSAEADPNAPAYAAQAERPDRPIKLRVQPTLLRLRVGQGGATHRAWHGVSWTIECKDAEEVLGVRDALAAFFRAVAGEGPTAVHARLTGSPTVQ